jgi:anti-sigma regulatory factor (Ser/Thr protein kinase)
VLSERGRGLYIVAQLTEEFHVTKRPHGGSHARAVLSRSC